MARSSGRAFRLRRGFVVRPVPQVRAAAVRGVNCYAYQVVHSLDLVNANFDLIRE